MENETLSEILEEHILDLIESSKTDMENDILEDFICGTDESSLYAINEEEIIYEIQGTTNIQNVNFEDNAKFTETTINSSDETEMESVSKKESDNIPTDKNETALILKTNPIKKDYSRHPQTNKISYPLSSKFLIKIPCKIDDPIEALTHKCEKCAFLCDVDGCDFSTRFKNAFSTHKIKHTIKRSAMKEVSYPNKKLKDKLSSEPTVFACQYCPFKNEKYLMFVAHMKGKSMLKNDNGHPKSEVIVCSFNGCTFLTQDKELFQKHKKEEKHDIVTDQYDQGEREEVLSCEDEGCNFSTHNKVDMDQHKCDSEPGGTNKPIFKNNQGCSVAQKQVKLKYTCKYCILEFDNVTACKEHLWTHKTGICGICNLKFSSLNEYIKHKSLHARVFKCMNGLCSVREATLYDIKEHMKECKFGVCCQQCKYRALDVADLRKHEAMHISVNLTCNFCFLQFPGTEDMVIHYKNQHSSAFNCIIYNCKYCWFKSTEMLEIKRHFTEGHSAKWSYYECPVCNIKTELIVEYQIHFLQHIKC